MERIDFYSTRDAYGCFSNFAAYPIELDGKRWPTSEHYFQAQKFDDAAHIEKIRLTPSPMIAARLGRSRKVPIRRDWERVKDDVMRRAVLAKFTQHSELRETLLATGDARIVEHTTNDSYWGDGGDGSGRNMLGRILMEIREELRATSNEQRATSNEQ
jgi:N-glycosidase YbiA